MRPPSNIHNQPDSLLENYFPETASIRQSHSNQQHQQQQSATPKRKASPSIVDFSPSKRSHVSNESGSLFELYTDPEVIELKKQVKDLRKQLTDSRSKYERKVIDLSARNTVLEEQVKALAERKEKLEEDRRVLLHQQDTLRNQTTTTEDQLTTLQRDYTTQISILRTENSALKEELTQTNSSLRKLESEQSFGSQSNSAQVKRLETELESVQGELAKKMDEVNVKTNENLDAQMKILELEKMVRELKTVAGDKENMDRVKRELKEQVTHMQSLEQEVKRLRKENDHFRTQFQNIEILREEKQSLENKLSLMESLRKKLAELEVSNTLLMKEKASWASYFSDGTNKSLLPRDAPASPMAVSRLVASLQMDLAQAKEKHGALLAEIKAKESVIGELEQHSLTLETKLGEWMEKYDKDLKLLKRLEKGRALAQKEIEFLREQLKSYDTEESLYSENYDKQKTQRIQQLESLLSEHKTRIQELEGQLDSQVKMAASTTSNTQSHAQQIPKTPERARLHSPAVAAQKRDYEEAIANLKKENAMLQKEIQSLDEQVGVLERALGSGAYNPETTKIVQLRDNPASVENYVRTEVLESLKQENSRLLEELTRIQNSTSAMDVDQSSSSTSSSSSGVLVPFESLKPLQLETARLVKLVEEKEKRLDRIKQVYKSKALEYREAVYSLLGYLMDFQPDGRVKLTSMFYVDKSSGGIGVRTTSSNLGSGGNSGGFSFEFTSQEGDEGTMKFTGDKKNEEWIRDKMGYFVETHGNIPAFLSSITMGLFEEKTRRES